MSRNHLFGKKPWVDQRKLAVIKASAKVVEFNDLNDKQRGDLYDIVCCENENWDGEEVSVESLLTIMTARFNTVGLAPSRN